MKKQAMHYYSILLVLFLLSCQRTSAQVRLVELDLKETIELAQSDAPDSLLARTRFTNRYWNYQAYRADLKPQITFQTTLPDFSRSIIPVTQPDGTVNFVRRSQMLNRADIQMTQIIPATGASLRLGTGLERADIYATDDQTTSYFSNPITLGISQPLFDYNAYKWDKIIEPIRFEEARRNYSEDMEQVAYRAAAYFFDVLSAQLDLEAAELDRVQADSLYSLSENRYDVGRIAETELLQIELNAKNANTALSSAHLELQTAMEQMRNFLGIEEAVEFKLIPPEELLAIEIDPQTALNYARDYRSKTAEFRRRQKEADQAIARTSSNIGPSVQIDAQFGLSQEDESFSGVYGDLLDDERIRLGMSIPIADWGKAEARREIARSNRELVRQNVEQERIAFEQEILLTVRQFSLKKEKSQLAFEAYEVAQKRYDITRKRYLIGKIGVTDLNLALQEKESARRAYVSALADYWLSYYEIRSLTLYDFEHNRPLIRDVRE